VSLHAVVLQEVQRAQAGRAAWVASFWTRRRPMRGSPREGGGWVVLSLTREPGRVAGRDREAVNENLLLIGQAENLPGCPGEESVEHRVPPLQRDTSALQGRCPCRVFAKQPASSVRRGE